jgi:hypothetical protein
MREREAAAAEKSYREQNINLPAYRQQKNKPSASSSGQPLAACEFDDEYLRVLRLPLFV